MQKLRFPVDFVGITQYYSNTHQAVDFGWHTKPNENIYSCGNGVVTNVYWLNDGGNCIDVEYDNCYRVSYMHLEKQLVKKGDNVKMGDIIGIMGNTGYSFGNHLHLIIRKNGTRVNPLEHLYLYLEQKVSENDKNNIMIYHEEPTTKFNIGDRVIINGYLYVNANASNPSGRVKDKETTITRISEGTQHPYNTTGDLGWMDTESIRLADAQTIYVVQKSDTLSSIAEKYNTTWRKIYEDNKSVIGDNPDLIKPGQELKIG